MNPIVEKGRLLPDEERLDPAHTALVLIDIQNDFCDPRGVFGALGHDLSMMPAMAASTRTLVEAARRKGLLILFVRATYDGEVLSGPLAETYHRRGFTQSQCLEGSFGAGSYAGLGPRPEAPNEIAITKHRFSAFFGSEIDLVLRANAIRSLVFCGVVTSGCVESTLRDAFFRDYYVTCASDAVTEASPERHRASLHKIEQALGRVLDAGSIAAIWDRATNPVPARTAAAKRARLAAGPRNPFDPTRCALLLVDLQQDLCGGHVPSTGPGDGSIGRALGNARRLLAHARAAGMPVIHVRTEVTDLHASEAWLATGAASRLGARAGVHGAVFVAETAPTGGEWCVVKRRSSAFTDTRLDLLLRSNRLDTLLVCGVATEDSVDSTVRDAAAHDLHVWVVTDAVGTTADVAHLHVPAIEAMGRLFAHLCSVEDIVSAHAPPPR